MSNLKQKHKDYLIKNEIKDLTDLVNYVEILRNTSNLEGEDKQMLFDFAFLITNEQLSLKSFFAENKNPSKEFYNAFKQSISSPTFMDEVINDLQGKEKIVYNNTSDFVDMILNDLDRKDNFRKKIKIEETSTEVPKFTSINIEQILPKHVFDTIEKQEDKKKSEKEFDYQLPPYPTLEERNKAIEESFKNTIKVLIGEANSGDTFELGKKETEGKLNYELDWEFIQQLAERMSQNKGKYKPYNWMQPIDVEKLKQSLFRHVVEVMKGNYEDDGRTFGHLESISANVMMINYQLKNKS